MNNQPVGNNPIDSFAPVEQLTVEDEAAFMNRGRGKSIAFIVAALAGAVIAVALMLRTMDADRAYIETGTRVRLLAGEYFDGYWNCAVPATQHMSVESGQELAIQLQRTVERFGRAYASTLQHCAATLAPFAPQLSAMDVPEKLRPSRDKLVAASDGVLVAATALRERLLSQPQDDAAGVATEVAALARTWDVFDSAREDLLLEVDER